MSLINWKSSTDWISDMSSDSFIKRDITAPTKELVKKPGDACNIVVDASGTGKISIVQKNWLISAIQRSRGWLRKLREAIGQGMSATNSTRMPQHEDKNTK